MSTSLEHVLHLFDSVWFHSQIFQEKHEQNRSEESSQILKVRSHSENLLLSSSSGVSFLSDSQSPTSVLQTPRLQTIFSGKEVSGQDVTKLTKAAPVKGCERQRRKQRRGGKWSSKSLTELEFEELKGFKDLGFVFSEEDTEDGGDLALIVPGLQRLRRRRRSESDENVMNVERPYLSDAWSVMERNEALIKQAGLIKMKDRIRQSGMENELLMKEQIKRWAHSVATSIRTM